MEQKNKLLCLILAVVFTFSGLAEVASALQASRPRTRMGVISFMNSTEAGDSSFGSGMADILISELMQNRNYDIIERAHLDKMFDEIGGAGNGTIDASTAAQIGKVQGLNYMVVGTVVEAGQVAGRGGKGGSSRAKVTINIRVIDVETGKIIFSNVEQGEEVVGNGTGIAFYSGAARNAISKVAREIMDNIHPVEAAVVLVKLPYKEVTINMGREDGVRAGQRYMVIRKGEPIIGPDGGIVGIDTTAIAEFTIDRVEAGVAIGTISKINKEKVEVSPGKYKDAEMEVKVGDVARPMVGGNDKKSFLKR